MKYLIVVLVVVVVAWLLLRSGKRAAPAPPTKPKPSPSPATPQAMLQCGHCGVHLPRADALLDDRGAFCSEAHRLAGPR